MKYREFIALNCLHFLVDAYASLYGLIAATVRLSPATIGYVGTAFSLAANASQLLMGVLADRRDLRGFIVVGSMTAAVFVPLAGLFADVPGVFPIALILGGLGVAAFHPPGAVVSGRLGKHRATFFVGIFVTVGSMGFASGPALFTMFTETLGFERSYLLILPGLVMATIAFGTFGRRKDSFAPSRSTRWSLSEARELLHDHGSKILPLFLCVVARSVIFLTVAFYLPTILIARGETRADASFGHFMFCAAGCLGTMVVGALVGKVNRRGLQVASLVLGVPAGMLFLYPGVPTYVNYLGLIVCGLTSLSTNAMHVVMGQEISRDHASTLSSLMMGFGWGIGGLASALTGRLVEPLGLEMATGVTIALALLALPLVSFLEPFPQTARTAEPDSVEDSVTPALSDAPEAAGRAG